MFVPFALADTDKPLQLLYWGCGQISIVDRKSSSASEF